MPKKPKERIEIKTTPKYIKSEDNCVKRNIKKYSELTAWVTKLLQQI